MKFKVGDKVNCIKIFPGDCNYLTIKNKKPVIYGKSGVICSIDGHLYLVKLDERLELYPPDEDGNTTFIEKCSIWLSEDYLELADPVDEEADVDDRKAVYDDNLNTLYSHKEPLNSEDLKVGMVFDDGINYSKILYIYKKYVLVEVLRKDELTFHEVNCINYTIDIFLEYNKLIDKVPQKEIEVEEEIPVFLSKNDLSEFSSKPFIYTYKKTINGIPFGRQREFEEGILKIKVKKLVEFNWDTGKYDENLKE